MKACIEITLELLTKSLSDKIKILILFIGIGTSLQTAVLNNLWNISKQEAEDTVDVLWAYGLVRFTDVTIPPNNITQHCVKVHVVINQYIIECMDNNEVFVLSPHAEKNSTSQLVCDAVTVAFINYIGHIIHLAKDCLKYRLTEMETTKLPFYLKLINMRIVTDSHHILTPIQGINDILMGCKDSGVARASVMPGHNIIPHIHFRLCLVHGLI